MEIKIDELRMKMKHGDFTKIGKKMGLTSQAVSIAFKKEEVPPKYIKAALKVIQEQEEEIFKLNQQIKR